MNEILFKTNVGSHMWKMNNENSDTDLFECYIMPTTEVLKGRVSGAHFIQDKENKIDIQRHEISKVTSEIIKSNINYIQYVFSPIVLVGQEFLERYKQLAVKVISKKVYNSIHGLAIHNYKKYQLDLDDKLDTARWNKILRVIQFGINLMDWQKIEFEPFSNGSPDVYEVSMENLDYYKKNGNLQEEPLAEDVENLWDFVVNERIKRLNGHRNEQILTTEVADKLKIKALETTKENEKLCKGCGYRQKEHKTENGRVFYRCENETCELYHVW